MTRIVIAREHLKRKFEIKKWKIVFGRRKTGKTFFVKNFVKWDKYYFVRRNREITEIRKGYKIGYGELKREIEERKDLRIVIDEFHRLPEDFLDFLHSLAGEGADLILITSSLHFSKEILGKNSPLLGLVHPIEFHLPSPLEILKTLRGKIKGKDLLERAVFLREPCLISLYDSKDFVLDLFDEIRFFVPTLIGEIFNEEDRKLTEVYEGILYSIADGKRTSGEIANELYSNRLISKNTSSEISPHLKVLSLLRIIKPIEVFGTKRITYHYIIESAPVDFYYFLDSKYGIPFLTEEDVKEAYRNKISEYLEWFLALYFREIFGGSVKKISKRDFEIDITLCKFKKIFLVAEVKWKKEIDRNELRKIEEKLNKFKDCKRILIVPNKNILPYEPEKIEVWDVEKIIDLCK